MTDYGQPLYGQPNYSPRQTRTVHERDEQAKPVLYDVHGKPLTRSKRRVGFDPERLPR